MTPEYICVISNSINYIKSSNINVIEYPNPFDDLINIESDKPMIHASLTSIDGRLIGSWAYDNETAIEIKLPVNISSGLYLLSIQTRNGFVIKKIIHE